VHLPSRFAFASCCPAVESSQLAPEWCADEGSGRSAISYIADLHATCRVSNASHSSPDALFGLCALDLDELAASDADCDELARATRRRASADSILREKSTTSVIDGRFSGFFCSILVISDLK